MTKKRFTTVYDEQSKMMQYVDAQKEEPNRWAIWNVNETLQIMNELATNCSSLKNENEQLKSDKEALIDFIKMKFPKSWKHILEGFE